MVNEKIAIAHGLNKDEYKYKNYVTAYRNYYQGEKKYFAKWEKGRSVPKWWT